MCTPVPKQKQNTNIPSSVFKWLSSDVFPCQDSMLSYSLHSTYTRRTKPLLRINGSPGSISRYEYTLFSLRFLPGQYLKL
jgi:hypothetical protein